MEDTDASRLSELLAMLLRSIQSNNQFKSFGQCKSCRHNVALGAGEHLCGLTQEHLSTEDMQLICREHCYPGEPFARTGS